MLTVIGQFKLARNGEYRLTLTPMNRVIHRSQDFNHFFTKYYTKVFCVGFMNLSLLFSRVA